MDTLLYLPLIELSENLLVHLTNKQISQVPFLKTANFLVEEALVAKKAFQNLA